MEEKCESAEASHMVVADEALQVPDELIGYQERGSALPPSHFAPG
jgi:hypothetical protein